MCSKSLFLFKFDNTESYLKIKNNLLLSYKISKKKLGYIVRTISFILLINLKFLLIILFKVY